VKEELWNIAPIAIAVVAAIIPFITTIISGWRRGLIAVAFVAGIWWVVWALLVAASFFESGANSDDFRFTFFAGFEMVAVSGSILCLVLSLAGLGAGLLFRRLRQSDAK